MSFSKIIWYDIFCARDSDEYVISAGFDKKGIVLNSVIFLSATLITSDPIFNYFIKTFRKSRNPRSRLFRNYKETSVICDDSCFGYFLVSDV